MSRSAARARLGEVQAQGVARLGEARGDLAARGGEALRQFGAARQERFLQPRAEVSKVWRTSPPGVQSLDDLEAGLREGAGDLARILGQRSR